MNFGKMLLGLFSSSRTVVSENTCWAFHRISNFSLPFIFNVFCPPYCSTLLQKIIDEIIHMFGSGCHSIKSSSSLFFLFLFGFAFSPLHSILILCLRPVVSWMPEDWNAIPTTQNSLIYLHCLRVPHCTLLEYNECHCTSKRNPISTRVVCGQCLYSRIVRLYFWLDSVCLGWN